MSLVCPSCSPKGEVTLHCLEADVHLLSPINHSSNPQCTGKEDSRPKWLLPWGPPLSPSPPSCLQPPAGFKRLDSHSSGLPCDSLPTPHLTRSWHFPSLGTQGFLAAFKMSESIVERLCISKQVPAHWPLGSPKLQGRRGQAPAPTPPSLQGSL